MKQHEILKAYERFSSPVKFFFWQYNCKYFAIPGFLFILIACILWVITLPGIETKIKEILKAISIITGFLLIGVNIGYLERRNREKRRKCLEHFISAEQIKKAVKIVRFHLLEANAYHSEGRFYHFLDYLEDSHSESWEEKIEQMQESLKAALGSVASLHNLIYSPKRERNKTILTVILALVASMLGAIWSSAFSFSFEAAFLKSTKIIVIGLVVYWGYCILTGFIEMTGGFARTRRQIELINWLSIWKRLLAVKRRQKRKKYSKRQIR